MEMMSKAAAERLEAELKALGMMDWGTTSNVEPTDEELCLWLDAYPIENISLDLDDVYELAY